MSKLKDLKARFGGLAIYVLIRRLMGTLDHQVLYYDRSVDPAHAGYWGPAVYLFWHEYIAPPFYLRPHSNTAMLLSRHRDAEWLSHAARLMGLETVRGSSKRGGDVALRQLSRKGRSMNLAITPDGPKGPRRVLAAGGVFLASQLQIPMVPLGIGYDRPWRLPTWDRFAVPRPFSRARLIFGPRIPIPADLDREGLEFHRQQVETALECLTTEAEAWAESGARRPGQMAMLPQARHPQPEFGLFPGDGVCVCTRSGT